MSLEAQLWAVESMAGDPLAKFVLLLLAGVADEDGVADLSRDRLAEVTEAPRVEIARALARLRARGLLAAHERVGDAPRLAVWGGAAS